MSAPLKKNGERTIWLTAKMNYQVNSEPRCLISVMNHGENEIASVTTKLSSTSGSTCRVESCFQRIALLDCRGFFFGFFGPTPGSFVYLKKGTLPRCTADDWTNIASLTWNKCAIKTGWNRYTLTEISKEKIFDGTGIRSLDLPTQVFKSQLISLHYGSICHLLSSTTVGP